MKQLVHDNRSGRVRVEEVPTPALRPGGLLVWNACSVISWGTERAAVKFGQSNLLQKAKARPDLLRQVLNKVRTDGLLATYRAATQRLEQWTPLGYSCAGHVAAVGEDVEGFAPGQRVACAGAEFAHHAEMIWAPVNLVAPVPENVSTEGASFATLGSIALHGVHRAGIGPGDRVAVIGLGLVGLLTVQILRAYGCPTFGTDIDPRQLKKALEVGLERGALSGQDDVEAAALAFSKGAGVDAVIVTAATKSPGLPELAGQLCRDGATVCIVGDVPLDVPRRLYYEKELQLVVSRSYGPGRYDPLYELKGVDYPIGTSRWTVKRNLEEFLRLLSDGRVQVEPLIARHYPIERASEAYGNLGAQETPGASLIDYPLENREPVHRLQLPSSPRPAKASLAVGLIGAGDFARTMLLPALKRAPDVRLKLVATATGLSSSQTGRRWGFETATTDYRDVLGDPEIGLVVIATRHNLHAPLAAEALRAGKDVFVEKPLCLDMEGLRAVAEAAQAGQGRLLVGFNRRFAPLVGEVRAHLGSGQRLLMNYVVSAGGLPDSHWLRDREEGGGRLVGEVCHFVDLLCHLTGRPPTRVYALGGAEGVRAEDFATVVLDFDNGSVGTITYSGLGPERLPKEHLQVIGEGRAAVLDNFRSLTLYRGLRSRTVRRAAQDKGHRELLNAFIDAIRQGGASPIPLEELLRSSHATLAIPEALRRGQPVILDLAHDLASPTGAGDSVQ